MASPAEKKADAAKKTNKAPSRVAVVALGADDGAVASIADTVLKDAAKNNWSLVFVVDGFDFAALRDRDLAFEQVVNPKRRRWTHPSYDWAFYRRRQFFNIGRLWTPKSVVAFGGTAPDDCLNALKEGARRPLS